MDKRETSQARLSSPSLAESNEPALAKSLGNSAVDNLPFLDSDQKLDKGEAANVKSQQCNSHDQTRSVEIPERQEAYGLLPLTSNVDDASLGPDGPDIIAYMG